MAIYGPYLGTSQTGSTAPALKLLGLGVVVYLVWKVASNLDARDFGLILQEIVR